MVFEKMMICLKYPSSTYVKKFSEVLEKYICTSRHSCCLFRFQHGTDSRSSVAQRTVLPNVASTCGNQGGIVMTDDVEPEYVKDHQRTPQSQYIQIST